MSIFNGFAERQLFTCSIESKPGIYKRQANTRHVKQQTETTTPPRLLPRMLSRCTIALFKVKKRQLNLDNDRPFITTLKGLDLVLRGNVMTSTYMYVDELHEASQ